MKWYFLPWSTIITLVAALITKNTRDLACFLTNTEESKDKAFYLNHDHPFKLLLSTDDNKDVTFLILTMM